MTMICDNARTFQMPEFNKDYQYRLGLTTDLANLVKLIIDKIFNHIRYIVIIMNLYFSYVKGIMSVWVNISYRF